MFVGTFDRSIDNKGRLALPPIFRHDLSDGGVVSNMQICLGLWTPEGFNKIAMELEERAKEGQIPQTAMRNFYGSAEAVSLDAQGRITIPERHRSGASLEDRATVLGRNTRIEIFPPAAWHEIEDPASVAAVFEEYTL